MNKFSLLFLRIAIMIFGLSAVSFFSNPNPVVWNTTDAILMIAPPEVPTLTSTDAAHLAYEQAVQWNPSAVIWEINSPVDFLTNEWTHSDQSQAWIVTFADPQSKKLFVVDIRGGVVAATWERDSKMINTYKNAYPKNEPGVSMARAMQTAMAVGASLNEKPFVDYLIDNPASSYNGRPVWQFTYPSTGEIYVIDGLNGDFLEIANSERA